MNSKLRTNSFPIVGIGASAGGIEAITDLLNCLPPKTGMAFIYIQHLDPHHESNLNDILARQTAMPVVIIQDQMQVEPDHLYVVPSNKELRIVDEVLQLTSRSANLEYNLSINFFFSSLAESHKERAIGIVLSGMASDGALGLKAIRQVGGLTYAQDESARFESMPKAAIAESAADAIMSPREIADDLAKISKKIHLFHGLIDDEQNTDEPKEDVAPPKKDDFANVLQLLKNMHGIDFTHYKKSTIKRRIIRRLLIHKIESVADYVIFLKKNPDEVGNLYNDLLINVTHFFRDPDVAEYLKTNILPGLLKNKTPNNPLRIWVAACSTGEEAYSMAMLILEIFGDLNGILPVQIFATDLSELAITKARLGVYTPADVHVLSPERLSRFFSKVDGHYRIDKNIRDMCIFAPHNLFKDPPFSRVDIISCCNVLIYLDTILQKKIMSNFHYALNQNGFLILGQSETIGTSLQLFAQLEKKLKTYSKKNDITTRAIFDNNLNFPTREMLQVRAPKQAESHFVNTNQNIERLVDRMILADFSPAGVVVNHDLDIVQFRGSTSLFLEPAPGQASLNLLKMARSGLAFELRNAANKAIKGGQPVKKTGIEINHKGNLFQVAFSITPLPSDTDTNLLLIIFEEMKFPTVNSDKGRNSKDRRVKQLENELLSLREDMRSVLEAQEAVNEELQSANEEILSSNEELQSINEELETSKEEIESSNEELMTINQELLVRNDQLAEANSYTEAVIATIRESVLILDSTFRVKSANQAFYHTFKTTEKLTEGNLVYDLGNGEWKINELKHLLEELIPKKFFYHGFELRHQFSQIGEKIFLINAKQIGQPKSQQHFYLLAFEDITEHRTAQKVLTEREAWLQKTTDNLPVMIWVATPDKNFTYLNKTWLAFTGRTLEQEKGIGWTEGIQKDDIRECISLYHEAFDKKIKFSVEYRMRRHDGEYRWVLNTAVPSYDADNVFSGYIGSVIEIHDKRMANEELEKLVKERTRDLLLVNSNLEKSNDELQQFAYISSHDLQEPLRKIITFSERLKNKKYLTDNDGLGYLDKIVGASQRMTNLIDDLLNYSKASSLSDNMVAIDLNETFKSTLNDFELTIQEKNARITVDELPVIEGLPMQVNQLFFNLVGNALKFSHDGKAPELHVFCRKLSAEELAGYPDLQPALTYYEIIFKDRGIGFNPEFAEQVFVIFQRLNDGQKYAGTGIGLALCKKIVDNHGGAIAARSEPGQGAEFIVVLPEKHAR